MIIPSFLLHVSTSGSLIDTHTFVLILHVLGAGAVLGAAFSSLALTVRAHLTPERIRTLMIIRQVALYGVIWQLLTGIHLFSVRYDYLFSSTVFWVKIGLYFVDAILVTFLVNKRIRLVSAAAADAQANRPLTFWLWFSALAVSVIASLGVLLESD